MTGASKILTVSYGTFSCTLEGFDEPFNTMKAIAEYFRDLAADDRYFGAEPPTPDAAMLHKIAEREIQRRVEAKVSDHGVLLRADDAPPPRVFMPAPPSPSVASVAEAAPAVESAAARLSRLRAAQTQILPPAPALGNISSRFTDVEAYAEDQDAEPVAVAPAPVTARVKPAPEPVLDPVILTTAAPLPGDITNRFTDVEVYAEDQDAEPVAAAPAHKVWLVEPVVDPVIQTAPVLKTVPTEPAIRAEPAAPPVLPTADLIAEPAAVVAPEVTAQAADEPVALADAILSSLRETLAGLNLPDDQLASDISDAAGIADQATDDIPADAQTVTFAQSGAFEFIDLIDDDNHQGKADPARVADEGFADLPPVDAEQYDNDDAVQDASAAEIIPATAAAADAEPEVDVSPDSPIVAEKIQRARARVIKITRIDKKPAEAALSPDAEADLQNTLAALEAELAPAPEPHATSVEALLDAELYAPAAAEPADTRIAAADDAAVDRLLAQTNTQLEVPEVKRRRSAIAHLKAAVLATVADRKSDPSLVTRGAEVKMDPYRKDLDQAVRPSVSADRPAPLVLVSAQRIDRKRDLAADANRPMPQIVPAFALPMQPDRAQTPTALPVRPRRVTAVGAAQTTKQRSSDDQDSDPATSPPTSPPTSLMNNIFSANGKQSFSEFADSLGADSLAELIEAAAAYCTLVLDQPSFTRPMLFQQISALPSVAGLNPEDSLRSFGKLLRDGRIQKTYRGQFALSTTSPILTEAKRIAS